MGKWFAVLLATAAFAACSGENGGNEGEGGAGASGPTTGVGAGTPTSSGVGAGTPTSTGVGGGTPTSTGVGAGDAVSTGVGTPTSTGSGGTCTTPVDIAAPNGNPFQGAVLYPDPGYAKKVQSSIDRETDAALKEKMERVKGVSTAMWLDRIAALEELPAYLDGALALQNEICQPVLATIVVYDLPNRDCNAKASNGELLLKEDGMNKYKTQYIDKIMEILRARPNLRIVTFIEPDSLPNIATNLDNPYCAESEQGYREGVAYAIKNLGTLPNIHQYIDAAHSGWLGWKDNQQKAAEIFSSVLTAAGNPANVRGFVTNVSNYTLLEYSSESYPQQDNPCYGELDFVEQMSSTFAGSAALAGKKFVVDTSRNGRGMIRKDWGYWCNNIGAGMGVRPTANPGPANIDAYYWIKPPGDSDGVGQEGQPRFDEFCGYENADTRAPQAGQWFHEYFVELVKNANPAL